MGENGDNAVRESSFWESNAQDDDDDDDCNNAGLVEDVRALITARGITPFAAPAPIRPELVALGRALLR